MRHLKESQLEELLQLLVDEKNGLLEHLNGREVSGEEDSLREASGDLSSYDNHPGDLGTETFERERDLALDERSKRQLEDTDAALGRIGKGSYGVCERCGEYIPFERLQAVPSTPYCIVHASEQTSAQDRPVEEEILPSSAADRLDEADAWHSAEEHGSSDPIRTAN
ncbi:TraR/DksA C4-type zinc finger protein [Paenibacillus sp. GCM10023252]|uniref:TraR/DksA C4-type zinc finger protein n=1 Tax=Paenibacillus sp. GCM10023252 TaxID=3252649 RepID=UPI00360E2CCF